MPNAGALENATIDEALSELGVDAQQGLSSDEANRRLDEYGANTIEEEKKNPLLKFLSYFWGPIPWMLEAACVLSGIGRRWDEFFVILAMLLINGGVGFWHEGRAAQAIEALKETLALKARVLSDGKRQSIDARELVPGDIIILRRGDVVPADGKLVGDALSLDESALTGESLPVDKSPGAGVYTGTAVKSGEARAVVIATGRSTRFGRTVELVAGVQERSHFQQAVLRIGYFLMAATAVLVLIVVSVELVRGQSWMNILLFALILTVAGIPVALPAVLSVTMAVGARRLAAQKAIVSHLAAMEELAGVKLLFSDKTGTLTLNQLRLTDASILGITGVIESSTLLWIAVTYLPLTQGQLQTLLFLKLLVAGHLTLYVVRVGDWFWRRPWPSWKLLAALETTQVLGTLAAIFGWLVTPIPWWMALGVWGYTLVWMFLLNAVRIVTLRTLRPRLHAQHVERIGVERAERAQHERAGGKMAASERPQQARGDGGQRGSRVGTDPAREAQSRPRGTQHPPEQQ